MTSERFYISYSSRKLYLTCPLQYKKRYIEKRFIKADPKDALFGYTIGLITEWFYTRLLWSETNPVKSALSLIDEALEKGCREYDFSPESDNIFVFNLKLELNKYIPMAIETFRKHKLLSSHSSAEDVLDVVYDDQSTGMKLKLAGRADFIHRFTNDDIWILDGKGSKWGKKYIDSEQLIWYALLHYLKFRVAPTRLGFLLWKFPENPIVWVDYDSSHLRNTIHSTVQIVKSIKLNVFNATPSKECKMCHFKDECEDGIKYLEDIDFKSKVSFEDSIFGLDNV